MRVIYIRAVLYQELVRVDNEMVILLKEQRPKTLNIVRTISIWVINSVLGDIAETNACVKTREYNATKDRRTTTSQQRLENMSKVEISCHESRRNYLDIEVVCMLLWFIYTLRPYYKCMSRQIPRSRPRYRPRSRTKMQIRDQSQSQSQAQAYNIRMREYDPVLLII